MSNAMAPDAAAVHTLDLIMFYQEYWNSESDRRLVEDQDPISLI
jgi:hypothetical protein